MIDYKTLKHSDNGMPTWDAFFGPVLKVANTKDTWKRLDLINSVLEEVPLPNHLLKLTYPSIWHDPVAPERIGWAIDDLKIAGLLNSPEHEVYQISDLGKEVLKEHGLNITREFICSQPAYIEYQSNLNNKNDDADTNEIIEEPDIELTEKQVGNWFNKQKTDLTKKLLIKLQSIDSNKFVHMVVKLLSEMGYGVDGQSLITNDGGIDGIINKDPLGIETIYAQVKHYAEDRVVRKLEIDIFSDTLKRKNADYSVLITTSSFTSGAREAAKQLNIALVDGEMLTNLMVQYKVGVQVRQAYELYDVDDDFFEE